MPKFLSDGIFDGSSTDLIVDGKIGIGTASPSYKLDVDGTTRIQAATSAALTFEQSSNAYQAAINSSAHLVLQSAGNNSVIFKDGGATNMTIDGSSGNVGIATTNPSQKLHVQGNVRITGAIYDSNNNSGTSGQILSSTATGTDWVDQGDVVAGEADKAKSVILRVKNSTATAMSKGQVVCEAVSATPPSGNLIEVALADNNGTNTMPALGILNEDLDAAGGANDEGDAIMFGKVSGIDTSAFSVGDEVFVDDTPGGLTTTKPTGVKYIQKVGVVIRDDATNGTIEVFGAGRVNDVPTPLYIDHANQRLGIGVTSPDTKLHIEGNLLVDAYAQGEDNGIFLREGFLTIDQPSITVWDMSNSGASPDGLSINAYDGIRFRENGGEVARFKDGNFGIGTASPSQILHLEASGTNPYLRVTETGNTGIDFGQETNGNGVINLRDSAALRIFTAATERMRINSSGNVGIGTTSPGHKLSVIGGHIQTDGNVYANVIRDNTGGNVSIQDNGGNVGIGTTNPAEKLTVLGASNITGKLAVMSSAAHGSYDFYNNGTSYFNGAVTVDDVFTQSGGSSSSFSGNVGIGTNSPSRIFTIENNSGFFRINTSTSTYPRIEVGSASGSTAAIINRITGSQNIIFGESSDSGNYIFRGGNVGIGTTNPTSDLHISDSFPRITLQDTDGTNTVSYIDHDGSYLNLIARNGTNHGNIRFRRYNGTTTENSMIINSSGNVGIGTTSPGKKLDVNGDTIFRGELVIDGDSSVHSKITQSSSYLEVIGNITDTADGARMWLGTGQTDQGFYINASQHFFRGLDSSTKMYISTGSGNVGIGTTSPLSQLTVQSSNATAYNATIDDGQDSEGATIMAFNTDNTTTNSFAQILFRNRSSSVGVSRIVSLSTAAASTALAFVTENSNTKAEKMRITSSGNVGIGTASPASNAKLTIMGNQTFGLPGNGSNNSGRFLSIEGNTDSSGEGSGRIFFTEHNSTTASMSNYGMSIGYRGGSTSIVGADGNTWTGLSQIGNGQWGMWGHNNNATGSLIMRGDRNATYVDFVGNNINNAGNVYVANAIYHQGDTDTYILFNDNTQRFFAAGEEMIKFNSSIVTINEAGGNNDLRVKGNSDNDLIYSDGSADKVGIGTSSPSEKLEVNGNIKHTGLTMTEGTDVDQIKTFTMTYQLAADTWTDTGINGGDLSTGTYVMQVYADDHSAGGQHYDEFYSATISWFGTGTNSTVVDEIVVHRAGHAPNANDLQFRTQRHAVGGDNLMLQVKANLAHTAAMNNTDGKRHTYKFRRLI